MKHAKTTLMEALIVLTGLLLIPAFSFAGDLEPSSPPGSTMKTLDEVEPRIPINQADIPKTISTSGSYYLTEDVTAAGTAITIVVDDVTIDLMGYTIKGPDLGANYGVYINGRSNVEIRNGTIRDFYYGIVEGISSGQDHRVIDVRAISNVLSGISLFGNNHLVKNCTASDNGTSATIGIVSGINTSFGSTVIGNTVRGNGTNAGSVYGIKTGVGSTVTGNTVSKNGNSATGKVYGIDASEGSTVTGNTVHDNGNSSTSEYVFGIQANKGSTVTSNTSYNNGNNATVANVYGISTSDDSTIPGKGCTVTGNTSYNNGTNAISAYGIYLGGYNLVDQNTAYGNGTGAGSATNMTLGVTGCVYGINVAP